MPMPEGAEYTVLVAHPRTTVRSVIVQGLSAADDLRVIGEVETAAAARARTLDDLPDALLLAAELDDVPAHEVVRAVRDESPVTVVVAILDHSGSGVDDDDTYPLAREGAQSTVRTGTGALAEAVRGAIQGESVVPPRWAERATEDLRLLGDEPLVRPPELSPTELEVLERLAKHELPADIAAEYDVSERLVNLHTGYAFAKLQGALDELRKLDAFDG